jgi:hypothetical protein
VWKVGLVLPYAGDVIESIAQHVEATPSSLNQKLHVYGTELLQDTETAVDSLMAIDVWDHPRYRIVSTDEGLRGTNAIKFDGKSAINNNSRELKCCNKTIGYVLPTLFKTKLQYDASDKSRIEPIST